MRLILQTFFHAQHMSHRLTKRSYQTFLVIIGRWPQARKWGYQSTLLKVWGHWPKYRIGYQQTTGLLFFWQLKVMSVFFGHFMFGRLINALYYSFIILPKTVIYFSQLCFRCIHSWRMKSDWCWLKQVVKFWWL